MTAPLLASQVQAAVRLYARLDGWQTTDRALTRLTEQFPGFDREATLLKVTAVNALYGTNVFAVARMADHVRQVLDALTGNEDAADVVKRLADLPKTTG
jgi:hypothetical protein